MQACLSQNRFSNERRGEEVVSLKTAKQLFADALSDLMIEMGLDYDKHTKRELSQTIAICTNEYDSIWADFMAWVMYGEDKRNQTLDIVRASLEIGRMWK